MGDLVKRLNRARDVPPRIGVVEWIRDLMRKRSRSENAGPAETGDRARIDD
jgi:hypothetical protein